MRLSSFRLLLVLAVLYAGPGVRCLPAGAMDYTAVLSLAEQTAREAFKPDEPLPGNLRKLTYDELRSIRFAPSSAVWRMERLPFQLQFFHPGGLQKDRIAVFLVEGDVVTPVQFMKDMFEYEEVRLHGRIPDDVGFSGFRIHYPLNRADYLDELIVFQGASYFRALGEGCIYGASARGLGIDIGGGDREEFPKFRSFWVEKPDRSAQQIRVWALLDGPSVVGAYEFTIQPGRATVMDVRAGLFFRKDISELAVAPLTSMFWYGEGSPSRFGDFRPEVHDSDGLMIHTGAGEWLWRPLVNQTNRWRYASFVDNHPRGFGLLQRDRRFSSYEDLEALYHLRPSVWIEPSTNGWDEGELRCLELPSTVEYGDNIVLYWTPKAPARAGERMDVAYRMRWFMDDPELPPLGRVLATRIGQISYRPQAARFILDFTLPKEAGEITADALTMDISADRGRVLGSFLQRNDYENAWRVVFDVDASTTDRPVELRCFLKTEQRPLTETWIYQWTPSTH